MTRALRGVAASPRAVLIGTVPRGAVLLGSALLATGCSSGGPGSDGSVGTLAKVDGWREELGPGAPFAVLELAYDAETARAMWDENVGDDLPTRDGDPLEPGIYGSLEDVDHQEQVVGVYSSGESGTCPRWVSDVGTDGGTVTIATVQDLQGGDGCTDDFNPYRVIVVIDREDVPDADALATASVLIDGNEMPRAVVTEYPATG